MTQTGQQTSGKVKVSFSQGLKIIGPYVQDRLLEQVKAVWLIITYLFLFQTIVLGVAIAEASVIAGGIALVVVGLTFFMEGLVLGLMPLGEIVGVKLPQKQSLLVILLFALALGFLATLAEPAIGVLKAAGMSVKAWEAPLLFFLLNKVSEVLVYSVGTGVGIAVAFGMLRFKYGWSLKPFIFVLVGSLLTATAFACMYSENLLHLAGLAWDCGAVTTGPVTVPLVLALGIGISRIFGDGEEGAAGFGVVTLASLFPILTVLILGVFYVGQVPEPDSNPARFFAHEKTASLFIDESAQLRYMVEHTDEAVQESYLSGLTQESRADVATKVAELRLEFAGAEQIQTGMLEMLLKNFQTGVQAIGLLGVPMLLVLWVLLRERLPRSDETFLGLGFAIVGMSVFSIGIELGLSKLGDQIGGKIPAAYKTVQLPDQKTVLENFDPLVVQTAITADGEKKSFFIAYVDEKYETIPYQDQDFNIDRETYEYLPSIGPLYGAEGGLGGILVVLIFAFILGYGATLAEPALNALGATVEELTVGTFKKSLLMQAVAVGVGFGIAFGVAKIMFDIPLIVMCGPPYLILLVITFFSTEEFVNIGWDSAGVTTGPITVPLVLSMGLGIGGEVGVVEGFGILSMASVCPILSVLCVGLSVTGKRKKALEAGQASSNPLDVEVSQGAAS